MKKLTFELLLTYLLGFIAGCAGAFVTHWISHFWELSITVGIVVFACFVSDSISTYFGLRRNPKYQKNTKESD